MLASIPVQTLTAQIANGYRMPTPEESRWFAENATKIENVVPNDLGKARIADYAARAGRHSLSKSAAAAALPDYVDNSKLPFFPPVASQGGLNCCAAFSTTYYQFSHMANMANNTPATSDAFRTSTKWTFPFVNDGGNNGTNFTATYMILMKNGGATLKDIPYDDNCTQWSTLGTVWRTALDRRIDQIGTLGLLRTDTELANLKKFLNNGYVIAFSTSIGNWQYIKIKDDPATTADNAWVGKNIVAWTKGGCDHAMCMVGYNDNIWCDINNNGQVDAGEKGAIRIVNSWGPGFEDNGFTWIAYDALTKQTKVPGYVNDQKDNLVVETAWCTVKPQYTPRLVGYFTLRHAMRNQIVAKLGYSTTDKTVPDVTLDNEALNAKGGPLAFDGTTNAIEGTFCLDFTDLINANSLINGTTYRWYLQVTDKTNDGVPCTIKNFSITDTKTNKTVASGNAFPGTVDGATFTCYADLALSTSYQVSATTTTGGTLSASGPVYYEKNSTATVSVAVDSGFTVEDVLIDGVSSGAKTTVTFTGIAANHTVSFLVIKKAETGFTAVSGIDYRYYEGWWDVLPDFSKLTAEAKGKTDSINLFMRAKNDSFGLVFTGYIKAPEKGNYTFSINSDDGSRLTIGNKPIATYDGLHNTDSSVSGAIRLEKGYHSFKLEYFDHNLWESLNLSWAGPSFSKKSVGAADLASSGGFVGAGTGGSRSVSTEGVRVLKNRILITSPYEQATISLITASGRVVVNRIVTFQNKSADVAVPRGIPNGYYLFGIAAQGRQALCRRILIMR